MAAQVSPGDAGDGGGGDEEEEDGVELPGKGLVGGEPLVEGHEEDGVVGQPDGEEEDGALPEANGGAGEGADEVAYDGEMVGGVGHPGQAAPPPGHPLAVDLQLQAEDRRHQDAPGGGAAAAAEVNADGRGQAEEEEEAGDPRREEEVDPDGVVELAADGLEIEDDFHGVGSGDGGGEQEGGEPEEDVHRGAYLQELRGQQRRRLQCLPEDRLAPHAEADAEGGDGEAEEEGPRLVLRQHCLLRLLENGWRKNLRSAIEILSS